MKQKIKNFVVKLIERLKNKKTQWLFFFFLYIYLLNSYWFFWFFLIFQILTFPLVFFSHRAMKNSNRFLMYVGQRGSGKTTLGAKFALQYQKFKIPVWSNVAIKDTYEIDMKNELGIYHIENGLLIIDEAGIEFNNRKFKTFQDHHLEFFKKSRHYGIDIVYFSQGVDVDKILRDLTDEIYIVRRFTPFFIMTTPVIKSIGIDEQENTLTETLRIAVLGTRFHLPSAYWKFFSSLSPRTLKFKIWKKWQFF